MSPMDGDWTVAVDGHLTPTTLPPRQALTAVWQTVRPLVSDYQRQALHRLFGAGDTERTEQLLDGGEAEFPIVLAGGGRASIRIWRGDGLTSRQRLAARYRPMQLPREGRNPGLWAVQDIETGALVREDGRVLRWGIESSAQSWIARQVAQIEYQGRYVRAQAEAS
ncbi:hypothetical protein ACWC5I_27675 [Kitasatospora sp. NPDC001574]